MSLYKNIGPITFLSQNENVQIFSTQQYYVIQIKNAKSSEYSKHSYKILMLENIVQNFNEKFMNKNVFKVYSEEDKPPSLIIDRNQVQLWNVEESINIQSLCKVCKTILKSLQVVNNVHYLGRIYENMFFKDLSTLQGFYVHIPKQVMKEGYHINLSQKGICEKQAVGEIISFLNQTFHRISHVSFKLLMGKLKKCNKLQELKEQLQYFQKIYEVGVQKVQAKQQQVNKNLKQGEIKKNHRLYRKKYQEKQEKSRHKKMSPSLTFYRESFSKRHLNLTNLGVHKHFHSLSTDFFRNSASQTQYSSFSTRNKSSNAIHSSSNTNRHRPTFAGNLKNSIKLFKGSKQKSNNKNSYFSSTSQSFYKTTSTSIASNIYQTMNHQKKYPNRQNTKHHSRQSDRNSNIKSTIKYEELVDEKLLRELINKEPIKEKKITSKESPKDNKQESNVKSIKRKHKISKIEFDNNLQLKSIGSESLNSIKNIQSIIDQQNMTKIVTGEGKSLESMRKVDENILKETRQKRYTNDDKKKQEKGEKTIKQSNEIQKIKFNKTDLEQTCREKIQTKNSKQKFNLADMKSEKSKTIRKNEEPISQKRCEKLFNETKQELERINYIGECVTSMAKNISYVEQKSSNKYLWQLPAFVLYKEFYYKRLQVSEKFKEDSLKMPDSQRSDILKFMRQIDQENEQTKQSLTKLLKAALKKVKKCELDAKLAELAKICLNLDFSSRNIHLRKLNEICSHFIEEIEEVRQKQTEVMGFQIELIDALIIANDGEFNIDERNKIELQNFESAKTINYFRKRMQILCEDISKI